MSPLRPALALSDIMWPSCGAVWPSGWAVMMNPGGKASPGANHLPWEWSKPPQPLWWLSPARDWSTSKMDQTSLQGSADFIWRSWHDSLQHFRDWSFQFLHYIDIKKSWCIVKCVWVWTIAHDRSDNIRPCVVLNHPFQQFLSAYNHYSD